MKGVSHIFDIMVTITVMEFWQPVISLSKNLAIMVSSQLSIRQYQLKMDTTNVYNPEIRI